LSFFINSFENLFLLEKAIPTLDLIGSNSFTISWILSDDATGYEISVFNSTSIVHSFSLISFPFGFDTKNK